jgi:hypothetical protein
VANATTISIDGGIGSVQANGMRQVSPGNSTTYTLTASSAGGNDMRSVTVSDGSACATASAGQPRISGIMFNSEIASAGDALFAMTKRRPMTLARC